MERDSQVVRTHGPRLTSCSFFLPPCTAATSKYTCSQTPLSPVVCRWLKFEEDVEDGGERWSKPYVATLSLHSLFELRSCIMNGTVMLDMRANSLEEIAGEHRNPNPP